MFLSKAIGRSRIRNETANQELLTVQSVDGWEIGALAGNVNQSSAMKIAAVSACVDVVSNSMAKLPVFVMNDKTKEHIDDPLSRLLSLRPNEIMTPAVFKKLLETYRLLWGNAYALMVRSSRSGEIQELLPLPPDYTQPVIDDAGRLWYLVTLPKTGEQRKFRSWDILHFKNFTYDGINGVSTLTRAADVINSARMAQSYESKFYSQNARPSGVVIANTHVDDDSKEFIREEWQKAYGGVDNAFKVAVLDLGMDYKQIGISNADAQFIESKNVTVEDIARFFGVPLYKINAGKQSYSSNEQNAIEYVVNTLHPIVEQYEEEYTYKGLFDSDIARGEVVRINMMAELRGDYTSRGNWYKNMRESGAFSVDDILALEDMPPVPGGDIRLASLNYVPLDKFRDLSEKRNTKGGDSN